MTRILYGTMLIVNHIGFFIAPYFQLLCLTCFVQLNPKWYRYRSVVFYVGCSFLTGMVIHVGDVINLSAALLIFLICIFVSCEGTILQRLSLTLIFSSISFSFNALIDSITLLSRSFASSSYNHISRIILWVLIFFVLRPKKRQDIVNLSPIVWWLVDLLTLSPLCSILIVILLTPMEKGYNLTNFLILLVAFFSSLGLLWAVIVLSNQKKLEQEQAMNKINQSYYKNLEQEQFAIRRLRHDMANHLQTLSALPREEMRCYVKELTNLDALQAKYRFCENNTVNSVLVSKVSQMKQKQVNVDIHVSIPASVSIKPVDLCAVFSNSLDNAIEACEKLPWEKRQITVNGKVDKGLFMLIVHNSVNTTPKIRGNLIYTTKTNTKYHGFGLASIKEIVTRYGGSVELNTEGESFEITMIIPTID